MLSSFLEGGNIGTVHAGQSRATHYIKLNINVMIEQLSTIFLLYHTRIWVLAHSGKRPEVSMLLTHRNVNDPAP